MTNKSRTLHTLKYLWEYSDENHPVSTIDILEYLAKQGIKAHRTTINSDISQISEIGIDIVTVRSSPNKYYICERFLESYELKMLVDAVSSSKFITQKKSDQLIDKIGKLTSKPLAKELKREIDIDKVIKPTNEKIYYIIDAIQTAIQKENWITFQYFEYTSQKELIHKNNGYQYKVCPYTTFWRDDHYYLLGFSKKHDKIVTFRIDRMDITKQNDDEWLPPPKDFVPSIYANKVFEMYDGTLTVVTLKCENDLMDVIIDKFGEEITIVDLDDNHFETSVEIYVSPRFYGWLFGFVGKINIISPTQIKKEYIKTARKIIKQAKNT